MKKRKVLLKSEISEIVYKNEKVLIGKLDNKWLFEIGKETTTDLAEGISILMRNLDAKSPIWDITFETNDVSEINPERSLFWLSGGPQEWTTLDNYKKNWSECYLDFQEEFGLTVINILKKSKNFRQIREYFIKYLNLSIIYDFALSKSLIN